MPKTPAPSLFKRGAKPPPKPKRANRATAAAPPPKPAPKPRPTQPRRVKRKEGGARH